LVGVCTSFPVNENKNSIGDNIISLSGWADREEEGGGGGEVGGGGGRGRRRGSELSRGIMLIV
jgi:hypothetical protein